MEGRKGEHIYEALGFLDEYMGRFDVAGDDTVERFYPSEEAVATKFGALLAVIEREQAISEPARRFVDSEHFITYRSKALHQGLNALYSVRRDEGQRVEDAAVTHLFISPAEFESADHRPGLAYVVGAYQRYGHDNSMLFANALHKVELLVSLLRQAGCTDVSLESRTQGTPHAHRVSFSPCKQLQQALAVSTPHRRRK